VNVAIRGQDAGVAAAVRTCGGHVVEPAAAELILAVDDPAVLSLADEPPAEPVLPITPGGNAHTVARDSIRSTLATVFADKYQTDPHPVLSLSIGGDHVARAVKDTMVMTAEPARISEYGIDTDTGHEERFRADGVVVATPLGSEGYANAAGGPTVETGAGLSVVPLSPFSTYTRTWVLNPPVTLTVERDEDRVLLLADDTEVQAVPPWEPVELTVADTFALVRPGSRGGSQHGSEKL
jgi:NAD+ kinase